jgi:hypothetical protein
MIEPTIKIYLMNVLVEDDGYPIDIPTVPDIRVHNIDGDH